ncbi:PspC domain-containing protein [Paenibacillus lutrae]|uniref:PspC domain-containing protein n=1 Tax=Paenibacillus lutrae TaxID=2078573 RepID=A0A7X3FHW1_9BACL|nr:PspC domain-containing protein [Paenibacillus lutrae]MVO99793.1 PspC domain-containing protein [Paenibacillus lutrae]
MRKLYRSRTDKKVTGLCGGLAEVLNVDATLLRLLTVVAVFITSGSLILLYFIASFIVPKEPGFDPPRGPYGGGPYGGHPNGGYGGNYGGNNYGAPSGNQNYNNGGWNDKNFKNYKQEPPAGSSYGASAPKADNIDEMMKDIEKKAMKKEIEELRSKLERLEKQQKPSNNQFKGDV